MPSPHSSSAQPSGSSGQASTTAKADEGNCGSGAGSQMLLPPRRQASLPFHWSRHLPWLPGKWDRTKSWAAATRPTVCPHLSRLRTFRLSFYDPWVCFSFPPGMHPLHPTLSFVLTTPRCILLPGSSGRKGAQGLLAGRRHHLSRRSTPALQPGRPPSGRTSTSSRWTSTVRSSPRTCGPWTRR